MRDNNFSENAITEETATFSTKWMLADWLLVLSCESSVEAMKATADGVAAVKNGKTVVFNIEADCWIYGKVNYRPGFHNGEGVLTSKLDRVECIDNTLYAITESGSCYRLEGGIDGIGVRKGESITVEKVENGKTVRYEL